MRRETSTSKRAKMDPAWELDLQKPFKGRRPGGAAHPIPQAPRRPGQTYQIDLSGNLKPARVNQPCGAPNKRHDNDEEDTSNSTPFGPHGPGSSRNGGQRDSRATNPTTMEGIRPQRVATASAQGPCRGLASEAARRVCVRGRSRKTAGRIPARTNKDRPASQPRHRRVVALQPKHGTRSPVEREGYCAGWKKGLDRVNVQKMLGPKNHRYSHHAPARDWPIPPSPRNPQETTYVEVLPTR